MAAGLSECPGGIEALDLDHGLDRSPEFERILSAESFDGIGEVGRRDLAGSSEEDELLCHMRELSDVAGPPVGTKLAQRLRREAADRRVRILCAALCQEVLEERRDVLAM